MLRPAGRRAGAPVRGGRGAVARGRLGLRAAARDRGRRAGGALATELGWSPRRLIARFRDGIGLPPKAVARILRFENVVGRLGSGDSLADVAYDAGYYDQAHMNRDFREFAKCTPTEYVARQLPNGGGAAAVNSIQYG